MSRDEEFDEEDNPIDRSTVSELTHTREQELMAKLFSNQKIRSQNSDDLEEAEESSYGEGHEGDIDHINKGNRAVYESMGFRRVTEESDPMYDEDEETLKQEDLELEFDDDDDESENMEAIGIERSTGDIDMMRSSDEIEDKYTSMLLEIEKMKHEMEALNEENHNLENLISS